jgi:hypothetical protein
MAETDIGLENEIWIKMMKEHEGKDVSTFSKMEFEQFVRYLPITLARKKFDWSNAWPLLDERGCVCGVIKKSQPVPPFFVYVTFFDAYTADHDFARAAAKFKTIADYYEYRPSR